MGFEDMMAGRPCPWPDQLGEGQHVLTTMPPDTIFNPRSVRPEIDIEQQQMVDWWAQRPEWTRVDVPQEAPVRGRRKVAEQAPQPHVRRLRPMVALSCQTIQCNFTKLDLI